MVHRLARLSAVPLLVAVLVAIPTRLPAQPPDGGTRYALVIGVDQYEDAKRLPKLTYAEADAKALEETLTRLGFQVTLLVGKEATKKEIEAAFNAILTKAGGKDTLVVGFAGHGQQFRPAGEAEDVPFLCTKDCTASQADTQVRLNQLLAKAGDAKVGKALFLIDACRTDPNLTRSGVTGNAVNVKAQTEVLFAAANGQKAREHPDLKHGLFMSEVIDALNGKAKNEDGEVTWDGLVARIKTGVRRKSRTLFPNLEDSQHQTPHKLGSLAGDVILARIGDNPIAPPKPKDTYIPWPIDPNAKPEYLHRYNLKVRPGGQADFAKAPTVGVELYRDTGTNALLAVTESGHLAVTTGKPGEKLTADWVFALDLKVRKADENDFTPKTFVVGVETFKDGVSGKLLYLSQSKGVAFADPSAQPGGPGKAPVWQYAATLKCRKPDEARFTPDTKRFGLEAFKDENTGRLVYVVENGGVAVGGPAPAKAPEEGKGGRPPVALYGLVVRVRKADEENFTKETKRFGLEVYKDENSGRLLYVSETGSLAVVPSPATLRDSTGVTWRHKLAIKTRAPGVGFDKAQMYGIEVVEDNNTGYLIYISETGSIAVLPRS